LHRTAYHTFVEHVQILLNEGKPCLLAPEGKVNDSEERNNFSIKLCTAAEKSPEN
jgi:hypothetical protein